MNAYAILDLQPGVPDADIKKTYRSKSLLIHPDKTSNPQAPDAFDRLKKAQTTLLDEKQRALLDEAIADARMLAMRDLNLNKDSEEVKGDNDEFAKQWKDRTKWVLMDNEARRQRQAKADMREQGRAQRQEDEEIEQRKRKRDHEEAWEKTRDVRIESWRDFQKGKSNMQDGQKKKKTKKMKVLG